MWKLIDTNPATEITVDLSERRILAGGEIDVQFEIDDYTRWRLLEGFDDIGLTLRRVGDIDAFEAGRPTFLPKTLPARTAS